MDVVFTPTAGKICRIEHSSDLTNWTFYPDTVYGFGQQTRYHVLDTPIPGQSAPMAPTGPQPSAYLFFMVNAFSDGTAVATWAGQDGSPQKAYLSSFNLVYNGSVMREMIQGTRVPASPALPYSLNVWATSGPKNPAVVNLNASAAETATLAKLTSQISWVQSEMISRVNWKATHPSPPPQPTRLFDDRGQPVKQWFRVREYETDSNFDRIPDHLQLGTNGQAYNMDVDGDGIPNGYDRDSWPSAQYPALYSLLSNVLD